MNSRHIRIAFLSFVICVAATVAVADWATTFQQLGNAVLRMESMDGDGNRGVCSSAVINARKGFVLTAAHCVPSGPSVSMTVNERDAVLVKKNALLDLAILRVRLKDETAIVLSEAAPQAGASVAVVGYAFGARQLAIQAGVISNPLENDTRRTWMNVDTIPGDSGGVVVDAEGRLVGVTSAVLYSTQMSASHLGMAVPYDRVKDFVEDYLPPVQVARRK